MSKLKSTPGPWEITIGQHSFAIYAKEENHQILIEADIRQNGITDDTWNRMIADAKLRAAAPEMLEDKIKDFEELGPWLSAALEDEKTCEEFKKIIQEWFNRFNIIEKATGLSIDEVLKNE